MQAKLLPRKTSVTNLKWWLVSSQHAIHTLPTKSLLPRPNSSRKLPAVLKAPLSSYWNLTLVERGTQRMMRSSQLKAFNIHSEPFTSQYIMDIHIIHPRTFFIKLLHAHMYTVCIYAVPLQLANSYIWSPSQVLRRSSVAWLQLSKWCMQLRILWLDATISRKSHLNLLFKVIPML